MLIGIRIPAVSFGSAKPTRLDTDIESERIFLKDSELTKHFYRRELEEIPRVSLNRN